MTQTLILGSGLDGAPAPLGVPPLTGIVGPLGFIDLLGQWLGVDTLVTPEAERIAATLAALQGMEGRFWSASYKVDPWGTARRVLDLSDALMIAGWESKAHPDNPARVVDLAALPPPPVGLPDVLGALCAATLPSSLPRVTLVEPRALWPPRWRRLLARRAATLVYHRQARSLAGRWLAHSAHQRCRRWLPRYCLRPAAQPSA